MERFIEFVLQFGYLTPEQVELVRTKGSEIRLHKDDHFWEAGKAVNQVGFLADGVLRVFYYNKPGEEITRYFITENHLILPGAGNEKPYFATEYLSAVTPCTLVVFSPKDWDCLAEHIAGWNTVVQKITAAHHLEKIERRSELVSQTATERYLDFIRKFPTLINRVPLSFIASYLGITQSSLSRIRKNIR